MSGVNKFKKHSGRTTNGIKIATSSTETNFTAKRSDFNVTTNFTTVKSMTKITITAIKHFFNIFKNGITDIDAAVCDSIKMIVKNFFHNFINIFYNKT